MNLASAQHVINNNTRYKLGLKREIDLLHFASFLSPISFLNFPRLSLFPVPLSSLSASPSLPLPLHACHGITSYRSPAACHLHQTAGASSSGRQPLCAHVSVSTLARVHTHTYMRARAHTDTGTSLRQVGIQMDTDVTAVARFSTHRPLRSPLAPLLPAPARTPLDSLFFSFPLAPARHLLSGMSVVRWWGRERQEWKRSEQPHELRHRIPHALYTRCPKYHGFSPSYKFPRKIVAILFEGRIWLDLEFISCSYKVYTRSYKVVNVSLYVIFLFLNLSLSKSWLLIKVMHQSAPAYIHTLFLVQ